MSSTSEESGGHLTTGPDISTKHNRSGVTMCDVTFVHDTTLYCDTSIGTARTLVTT